MSRKKQIDQDSPEAGKQTTPPTEKPAKEKKQGKLRERVKEFCKAYIFKYHKDGAKAYYYIYQPKSLEVAAACASRLLDDPRVQNELRRLENLISYSAEDCLAETDEAIEFAKSCKQSGPVMQGLLLKAKIKALIVDRTVNDNYNRDVTSAEELVRKAEEIVRALPSVLPAKSDTLETGENSPESATAPAEEVKPTEGQDQKDPEFIEVNAIRPPAGDNA